MKKVIIIMISALAVILGAAAGYVYFLGGALPFGITLPNQPDFGYEEGKKTGSDSLLSHEITELFSSSLTIKNGVISGFDDAVPLLSSPSGLYTFAPYFPAKNFNITGFDCGRPMVLYFDYDQNYHCVAKPSTGIIFQLLSKGPPYYRMIGPENGTMAAELLIAQDIYGYNFEFVNKGRINETKETEIQYDSFIKIMTDIYNETSSELAVSKNLYDTITGDLCFKQLVDLDHGFTVNSDIRAYDPLNKRIILSPKGGLCITDITISKKTTTNKNLLKRVGPIGSDSYYLAYRQPLSGNVVISLPDGENYLYVTLSGADNTSDDTLFEFMLGVLTIDYTGSLALTEG